MQKSKRLFSTILWAGGQFCTSFWAHSRSSIQLRSQLGLGPHGHSSDSLSVQGLAYLRCQTGPPYMPMLFQGKRSGIVGVPKALPHTESLSSYSVGQNKLQGLPRLKDWGNRLDPSWDEGKANYKKGHCYREA